MQQNILEKLYPHLRFNHIKPANRSLSEPPPSLVYSSPVSSVSQKIIKKEPIIENVKLPEPKLPSPKNTPDTPRPKREKKVKIIETPAPVVEIQEPSKPEEPKVTNTNNPSSNFDPVKTIRETQIPKKGEKGLQRKYSQDQRKDMYLNKLSRKSVKKAEQEVTKVNEMLERVSHNTKNLVNEEKEIKRQLKLINTAKLFLYDSNIDIKDDQSKTKSVSPSRSTGDEPHSDSESDGR